MLQKVESLVKKVGVVCYIEILVVIQKNLKFVFDEVIISGLRLLMFLRRSDFKGCVCIVM